MSQNTTTVRLRKKVGKVSDTTGVGVGDGNCPKCTQRKDNFKDTGFNQNKREHHLLKPPSKIQSQSLWEYTKALLGVLSSNNKKSDKRSGFLRFNSEQRTNKFKNFHGDNEPPHEQNKSFTRSRRPTTGSMGLGKQKQKGFKLNAAKMMRIGQEKELEVEKVFLAICAFIILVGYPFIIYFHLY